MEVGAAQVSLDPFGNIYLLTEDLEFRKYDRNGTFESRYSDLQFSERSEIAAGHPFKVMIYYPDFELIRVFGNKLQVLAELDLNRFVNGEITAVAPSAGYQSFWVFDATGQQLIRIDQQYQVADPGDDLIPVLGEPIFPTVIKEREGWLYVFDPERGLFIFDNFGTYSGRLDIKGIQNFSVFDGRVFYTRDGELYEADPLSGSRVKLDLKIEGAILNMSFRRLAVRNEKGIAILRF